jgi:hypothetical protein
MATKTAFRRPVFFPLFLAVAALAATLPGPALAYIGPGAGISLLGALWALVAAVGAAIVFVVAWPIRRALKRRRRPGAAERPLAAEPVEARAPRSELG